MGQHVFLAVNGTNASDMALRFFEQHSGRPLVDAFEFMTPDRQPAWLNSVYSLNSVEGAKLSLDGEMLVTAISGSNGPYVAFQINENGTLTNISDHTDGTWPPVRQVGSSINDFDISPNKQHIAFACQGASGTGNKRLVVVRTDTWAEVYSYRGPITPQQVRFSPDGSRIAIAGTSGTGFAVITVSGWTVSTPSSSDEPGWSQCVTYSPDGSLIAVGHSGGWDPGEEFDLVSIYNATTLARIRILNDPSPQWEQAVSVAFSPDGTKFAMAFSFDELAVRVYETTNWTILNDIAAFGLPDESDRYNVSSIGFSQDGTKIIGTGGYEFDRAAVIMDIGSAFVSAPGNIFVRFDYPANRGRPFDPDFSPKGVFMCAPGIMSKRILGTVMDQNNQPAQRLVRVYNRADGRLLAETESASDGTFSFAFLFDREVQRIALDDDAAPLFNDKIDRIIPA